MTLESVMALTLAMIILGASPGPGVFATVAQALSGGFKSSLHVIFGIILGDITFLLFAIFGLSAVAKIMGEFFFLIKILGGAYLIWMGIKMWVKKADQPPLAMERGNRRAYKRFLGGLFITLGNPKVILFYVGFLPTFLDLKSMAPGEFFIVVCIIALVLLAILSAYAFSASRARIFFKGERSIKNLNRGAGTVMIGAGITMVAR